MFAAALLCALWCAAQTPQPFPQPGDRPPTEPACAAAAAAARDTAGASRRLTAAAAIAPSGVAYTGEAEAAPTEAMLGVPIYPSAQFIASYNAGRGQRYYLFGTAALVRRSRELLPDDAEAEGRADLRSAGDPRVRRRQVQRRHDGVSAGRDDQGLSVGRVAGLSRIRNRAASPPGSRRSFR